MTSVVTLHVARNPMPFVYRFASARKARDDTWKCMAAEGAIQVDLEREKPDGSRLLVASWIKNGGFWIKTP